MKKILLLCILILSIQYVSATTVTYLDKYSEFDGNGEPEYPNTGYMYGHAYLLDDSYSGTEIKYFHNYESYDPKGHICYVKAVGSASVENGCSWFDTGNAMIGQHWDTNFIYVAAQHNTGYDRGTHELYTTGSSQYRPAFDLQADMNCAPNVRIINAYILVYFSPYNNTYYINGTYSCVDNVSIYGYINSTYKKIDCTNNTPYSFTIFNNMQYKLVFSDGHEYEFTCNSSDVEYNYDACTYMTIQLFDDCSNLLINPFTVVYDTSQGMKVVYQGHDNPINIDPADVNIDDELKVIWTTWQGASISTCYVQFDHPANIYDQQIYWNFQVDVFDDICYQIENAMVIWDQDCIINGDEYPKRNGFTDVYGDVKFTLCENDNGLLTVEKQGYKTLDVNVTSSFDVYTKNYGVNVFLEQDNSSEESNWTAVNDSWNDTNVTEVPEDMPEGIEYTMLLYFKNQEGHRIHSVLNNTSYVRCFYAVKYPEYVNMKLDFERSVNGLGYTTLYSYPYSIDNNSCGYWEINNSYFNDPNYIYRAHIYDQTDEYIGRHAYLRVVAAPEEQNYTAFAIFDPNEPVIDYREYIKGRVFANATSGSLPDLSLELYDESDLIEYFNYTQSDFDSYGWAYWLLGYNYTLHHNYTLLLKNDVGDIVSTAYTYAEDMRGNRLTVKVIDPSGNPLDHSYIFLKDYGRIPTNNQCYGTFEGLANQNYYYKAEKGGYRSTGWDMVSPIDEDTLVTYTLIPESPVYQNRMAKTGVKKLYYPFMYILLIIMLVGGLIHVFN